MEIKVQKVLQYLFAILLLNHTLMVAPSKLFSFANSSITPCDGYLLSLYKASRAIFCKCETFDLLFAVDEVACFLFPVKQKQNEFNMQSDGALMKKHIKNISRNDVSAVHKAYGLCNGNSSCELIKLHIFKSDSCALNLFSQIPYGIFLL